MPVSLLTTPEVLNKIKNRFYSISFRGCVIFYPACPGIDGSVSSGISGSTQMIAANYTEFRTGLKNYLDNVENNNETLIIKRGSGKGTVLISLNEYNSIMETLHLLSSKKNAKRLFESIEQMETGKRVKHTRKLIR
jgi:antitoxin YefM